MSNHHIHPSVVFELVQEMGQNLPSHISAALGSTDWSQRVPPVEVDGQKFKIRFFSDGLDLKAKVAIETAIRETVKGQFPEIEDIVVYFERRDKTAAPASGRSGATQHSHSAEQQHQQHQQQKQSNNNTTNQAPTGRKAIPNVKHIIAVASGKGGVGKSTVSVNLTMALHNQGYKVGLLDADIYGPSLPIMFGLNEDPTVNAQNKIVPPEKFGIKLMSFGFFAPPDSAVIWRGPMIIKALQQFFYDVDWGELDFLVIDLPPGTGDAQLTLVQSLPLSGAVIVTTPQNVALADAIKGIVMFRKTEVPILGVVENMSTYQCPSCGTESHIFGTGGAEQVSQKFDVPVLGHVPLLPEIRAAGDDGVPLTTLKTHPMRVRFAEIAEKAVTRMVELKKQNKTQHPH